MAGLRGFVDIATAMVAFIFESGSPIRRNLNFKCGEIGRTTANLKKNKMLSYGAENWTPGVF